MNNSSENSKRVIMQTNNPNQKEKEDEEDFIIIDPAYQYISYPNEKLENDINNNKPYILELEVLNSSSFPIGTRIKIDQFGLIEGSLRNAKDNITYFGFLENSENNTNEKDKINDNNSIDYLLPLKHCEKYGRFFKIQYITKLNEYIIKDLGNGLGTFIKIQDSINIRKNSMINIGDSYLIFNFVDSNEEKNEKENGNGNGNTNGINKKLKVKIFDSKNNNDIKESIFDNNSINKIHIGRKNHGNDIELNDHLSSKINCVIQYIDDNGWIIKDGNEVILKNGDIKRNSSTNGTWFLANENIKIINNLIFKSNFSIFKCNFIYN